MASIETAIFSVPTHSAHAVEKRLGWVDGRSSEAGNQNSGRIAKARVGKHVLQEGTLATLALQFDDVSSAIRSPLWDLVRTGSFSENLGGDDYGVLNDAAYWAIHVPIPFISAERGRSWLIERPTEDQLAKLAAQGSLDAVAALWMLILDSGKSKSDLKQIFTIATYIPPTLALLSLSPVGLRIARLLFARIRQQTLDNLTFDGYQLSLGHYDLAKVAGTVTGWSPGCIGPANPYTKERGRVEAEPLPSVIHDWLERSRAPMRKVRRQPAKPRWRVDLSPSAHTIERRFELEHPSVMHPRAISICKAELKDYWEHRTHVATT
ncbi:hypothetical protein B0E51_06795 [Rhodanobacter sp. C05]|nr:hypothetical protein B0E51_06795 [Rhodanobacter sp. C05]